MKLLPENLATTQQLEEFDQWLTPKLERVKDTVRFRDELSNICQCIELLAPHLCNFEEIETCDVDRLCDAVLDVCTSLVEGQSFAKDEKKVFQFLHAYFNLLFLATGATDNNLKNHFLIKLKEDDITPLIPKKSTSKKTHKFTLEPIPSATKSKSIAKTLSSCLVGAQPIYAKNVETEPFFDLSVYFETLLKEYSKLILEDYEEVIQLWVISHSYILLKNRDNGNDLGKFLINSCTIFKVRGSVSASGGHISENILRDKLTDIGLEPGLDFNTTDVVIGEQQVLEENQGKPKSKTRAYDFILPYNIEGWAPKPQLFIQAQFYAGDSGSVSHKVIDQTDSSRAFTLSKYQNARFIEYLDGAGYYASLRTDLKHMLASQTTASFFQVKSILVRLRRELQVISFLTPIEIEHCILTSDDTSKENIINSLIEDGYDSDECKRAIDKSISLGYIEEKQSTLKISEHRIEISRRLLILDSVANNAEKINDDQRMSMNYILSPGYGSNHGILESSLSEIVCDICKQTPISAVNFTQDLEWLMSEGVLKRR